MGSRRLFIASAVTLLYVARTGASQRTGPRRIGYLAPGDATSEAPYYEGFRQGLATLGYIEGKDVLIEFRPAENRLEALSALAEELVSHKVDLIFVSGTAAALAAKHATGSIPIVFGGVSDPIGSGLVVSLARPGGNVTGITDASVDLTGKRIDLLKDLLPRLRRVVVLGDSRDPIWEPVWKQAQSAGRQARIETAPTALTSPDELDGAFRDLKPDKDALLVAPQAFCWVNRRRIISLAQQVRVPAIYEFKGYVVDGGLLSYSPAYPTMYGQAARLVDKIFLGSMPADIPVEQPTHFELVINRRTADAIQLTVPRGFLQRADEVIQ